MAPAGVGLPLLVPQSRPLVTLTTRPFGILSLPHPLISHHLIAPADCCVASRRAAVMSCHHAALSSFRRPLTAPPSCHLKATTCCCVAAC